MPIAPPTRCSIQPVPNRNQNNTSSAGIFTTHCASNLAPRMSVCPQFLASFPGSLLQVIKNWRQEQPGNEARVNAPHASGKHSIFIVKISFCYQGKPKNRRALSHFQLALILDSTTLIWTLYFVCQTLDKLTSLCMMFFIKSLSSGKFQFLGYKLPSMWTIYKKKLKLNFTTSSSQLHNYRCGLHLGKE